MGTDLRLWLRRRLDGLDIDLDRLAAGSLGPGGSASTHLIPGYTHLQRAQPLCLAHHLLAYVEMLQRDRERLKDVRGRVNISPLGAAALAGTPVPIDRRLTAEQLGFDAIYANSLDAVSGSRFLRGVLCSSVAGDGSSQSPRGGGDRLGFRGIRLCAAE